MGTAAPVIEEGNVVEGLVSRVEEYGIYLEVDSCEVFVLIIYLTWYPPINHRKLYPLGKSVRAKIIKKIDETHFVGSIRHLHKNPYYWLQDHIGEVIPATVLSFLGASEVDVLVGLGENRLRLSMPIGEYGDLEKGQQVGVRIISVVTTIGSESAETELVRNSSYS